MQIPYNLIQRRRKARVHIQEHAIHGPDFERPPEVADHLLEALGAADPAHLLPQGRRAPDGHEPDGNLRRWELARGAQRRGGVARQAGQDHGRGQREGQVVVWVVGVGNARGVAGGWG